MNECNLNSNKCNKNWFVVIIRVVLSLLVIALGIYKKNWIGLLGVLTLITALTGQCGTSIRIPWKRKPSTPKE